MSLQFMDEGDRFVSLRVTHSNMKNFILDDRFSLGMTVESIKNRLWKKCGTSVNSMDLALFSDSDVKLSNLNELSRPLGFYSPQNGYRLHVVDLNPYSESSGGWMEDTSLVEKYRISEEAYNKLDVNLRKFKEKLKAEDPSTFQNNKDDNYMEGLCTNMKKDDNYMEGLCTNMKVGDRCEVLPGENRGVVKFIGRVDSIAPGFWVGVEYDEPLGKHDGMVKGVRYFLSSPLHGALVRPDRVKVGDYPEFDMFEEEF